MLALTAAFVVWARLVQAEGVSDAPFPGITYITRTEMCPRPVTMHIVVIDLAAPGIGFKVTPPGGTLETVRQTAVDFLNQEQARIAINAHFFLPFPSLGPDANV